MTISQDVVASFVFGNSPQLVMQGNGDFGFEEFALLLITYHISH
jgi:hypothetical protein